MDPLTWCLILAAVFVVGNPMERWHHAKNGTTPPSHLRRMKQMDKAHEARMARMKAGRLSIGEALSHRIAQAVANRAPRTPVHERGPIGKFLGLWHQDAWEWATTKRRNIAGATGEWRGKRQAKRAEAKAERERKARDEANTIDAEWSDEADETPDMASRPAEPGPTVDDTTAPEPVAPKALTAAAEPVAKPVIPDVPMSRAEPVTDTPTEPEPAATAEPDDLPLATVYELRPTTKGEIEMSAPAITAGPATNIGEITNLAQAQQFTEMFAAATDVNLAESRMRADKLATAATISDVDAAQYATGAATLATAYEQIAAQEVSGDVLATLTEASSAMQQVAEKEAAIREYLTMAAALSGEAAELMATVQENVSAANTDLHRHDGLAEQHQALAGDGGNKAFYANA